jgi:endonuclease/exonuclease/phosphatase family metal-dependent hydrolase
MVAVLASTAAGAEDRRADKSRLVLMTLNAEFLWDGREPEDGRADFDRRGDPDAADAHLRRVAAIIARADADVVNLCEVEDLATLRRLNDVHLAGRGYRPYLVQGKDTETGQDVALLTRIDPEDGRIDRTDVFARVDGTRKGVTKNWYARFRAGDLRFAVVAAHLLAGPRDRRRATQREAQAEVLRSLAVVLHREGYPVAVMGDLNDFDGAPEALDRGGHTPSTSVLASLRGMDPVDPGDDLVNALARVPRAERYTHVGESRKGSRQGTVLDYVLLSPELAGRVTAVEIPKEHDAQAGPDHYPVVVRLRAR